MKLGGNEACWCGSGESYEDCHLNRELEAPLPPGQFLSMLKKLPRVCLHPEAPTNCTGIGRAHTIQRMRVLERITDQTKHVLTFRDEKAQLNREPASVGWRDASTFPGFCEHHDGKLFAPIDKKDFVGDAEQSIVSGYRAICHELALKRLQLEQYPLLMRNVDRGLGPERQRKKQAELRAQQNGVRMGIRDFERERKRYAEAMGEGASGFSFCHVYCEGTPTVVTSGAFSPPFDWKGNLLQRIARMEQAHICALTTNAAERGFVYCFSWPKEYTACEVFVRSLTESGEDELPSLLMIPSLWFLQNTYFSPRWWTGLDEEIRERLGEHALATADEVNSFPLPTPHPVPLDWTVSKIEWR